MGFGDIMCIGYFMTFTSTLVLPLLSTDAQVTTILNEGGSVHVNKDQKFY